MVIAAPPPLHRPASPSRSHPRRRVKTLQKPAHTPEESIAATGQSAPDKVQRGAEPIVRWSASHSTAVKGAGGEDPTTKPMDV